MQGRRGRPRRLRDFFPPAPRRPGPPSPLSRVCQRSGVWKPGSGGVWGRCVARARRTYPPGPADGSDLPALSSSAEELIATIGLEPGDARSGWHVERLENLSRSRIDSPQIALVTLPGAVPELPVDPGHPGDEAVGLDRAKNRPRLGVDLVDLPVAILAHPERPFGPREPRVAAAAGRRDGGQHTAGLRIDFQNAIFGDLVQVLTVEGRAGV